VTRGREFERVLRWYPAAWRRRYGGEMIALLEDTYGDGGVPWRCRLALQRAGSAERLRACGLLGPAPAPEGVRAGSLLVLWAWAIFMVAGSGFANVADNWKAAVPSGAARLPALSYGVVFATGLAGAFLVLLGAGGCMPALVRFWRAGGWPQVRGRVLAAVAVTAVTFAAVVVMAVWARHLNTPDRNGALWSYSAYASLVALLLTATIASGTAAATAIARRLEFSAGVLRYLSALAVALALVMAALVVGTVAWWTAIASRAPWFFSGAVPGSAGTTTPPELVVVGMLMALGLLIGITGAGRAVISARRMT
jgi:hypothetical protein